MTGTDIDSAVRPLERKPMSYETSVPGIFAAGDVGQSSMKRVASAVGEGAGAVQNVHQFMEETQEAALA
jgi:thioredoxin reductase (NADPH)